MSGARLSTRRPAMIEEPEVQVVQGNAVLMGLRVVLLGMVVALVGVLGHVAWKIITA
jgi:hypothetical protein